MYWNRFPSLRVPILCLSSNSAFSHVCCFAVLSLSRIWLFAIPWTTACQASLSLGFIFQARIVEWVAISFSGGSSWPRDQTWVSCIAGGFFTIWATREALEISSALKEILSFNIYKKSSQTALSKQGQTWGYGGDLTLSHLLDNALGAEVNEKNNSLHILLKRSNHYQNAR